MITLLNSDGFVIDEIDINFDTIYNKVGLFDPSRAFQKLSSSSITSSKIKFKTGRVTESNFHSVFGEYKKGKWYGRGEIFGIYENDKEIFSFVFDDFYIKSTYICDEYIEVEFSSTLGIKEGISSIILQSLRNKKLNDLGVE